jgi:RNA polymerase sigma-70 factor, ECF subfamily
MSDSPSRVMNGFEDSIEQVVEFDRIVEFYRPRIFRFALASLRDRDAAETVSQDCFLKAYRAYPSFRGECSVQTWLMGITINLIRDHARSRRLRFWRRAGQSSLSTGSTALNNLATGENSPEVQAVLKQQIKSVWAAADLLPARQRCVFLLRFVEDMDILEIGAATAMKEGTVKKHLFRALKSVRLRMGQGK